MSVKPEMLNRGIFTSMDPSLLPAGALQAAENARYHPGDPAIYQSEGRALVGTSPVSGDWALISGIAPFVWDTGTQQSPGVPNLKQILLLRDNRDLFFIPAETNPSNPSMDKINAFSIDVVGVGGAIGPDLPVAIQFRNEYYLLTGDRPVVIKRPTGASSTQQARRSGFPIQIIKFNTPTTTGTGDYNVAKGFHFWWFTWYDAANDMESDVDPDAVQFSRSTSSALGRWNLTVDQAAFDAAVPRGAQGIRIYKTLPFYQDVAFGSLTPPGSPWPVGYRLPNLVETSKAYIPFTLNEAGLRFPITTGNYEVLSWGTTTVPSTAENENHLTDYPIFPFGTISLGGIGVNFGINGQITKANTGDVFEESLIINDLDNKRNIRYSMNNNADQFPEEFYIPFDTNETDEVVAIRRLGNKLGVFLRQSVWRVEWLPNQSEFDFSRGRVMDEVQGAMGAVGVPHYCVAKFSMPGQGPMLTWLARNGHVYATNLYDTIKLTPHLISGQFGEPLSSSTIHDDPDNERLIVQVGPQLWFIHYDEAHVVEGQMAITGPMTRPALINAANMVTRTDEKKQLVTINNQGKPCYEGFGFSDAAGGNALSMNVTTREIYPAGLGEELESESFFVSAKNALGEGTIQMTVRSSTETSDVDKINSFVAGPRALTSKPVVTMLERYIIGLQVSSSSSPIAVNYVGLETDEERQKLS